MLALPALLFAVFAALVVAHRRLQPYYLTLSALSRKFSGGLSKVQRYLLHQPCFIGSFSGISFSITYITGRAGGYVYYLKVTCKFPSTDRLKIFMYDKNPGTVLLTNRINIGDHDFDKYFIFSNMPEEAIHYFADDSKRENIKRLVANGWQLPTIMGGSITTYSSDRQPKPQLNQAFVESTLRNLIALRIERI